jgi:hypothetical protein
MAGISVTLSARLHQKSPASTGIQIGKDASMVKYKSREWYERPWRAEIMAPVRAQLATMSDEHATVLQSMMDTILANPESPENLERERMGLLWNSRHWPRYRVAVPGIGSLIYGIIEHAPPVYFKVVVFENLLVVVPGSSNDRAT